MEHYKTKYQEQFWTSKFTLYSYLEEKKWKIIKFKKILKFWNIYKNGKNNYKIWWYWNHQHKRPISMRNIDINKIVVADKASFG